MDVTEELIRKAYTALGALKPSEKAGTDRILHRITVLKVCNDSMHELLCVHPSFQASIDDVAIQNALHEAVTEWEDCMKKLDEGTARSYDDLGHSPEAEEVEVAESTRRFLLDETRTAVIGLVNKTYPGDRYEHVREPMMERMEDVFA